MEQNMTLGKKYYAYDLSEIFEFDESITFLFVFEPKCGNLEFGDDGYSARVIKDGRVHKIENWDCSNYKNIYYLFHTSGQDVTFEELIPYVNEDGASFIEPLVAFEPILQRNNVEYIEHALTSYVYANVLWKTDSGFLLCKNRCWEPELQSWIVYFNQGFKKIEGKYELNKIECNDPSIVYDKDLRDEMFDLSLKLYFDFDNLRDDNFDLSFENDENEQNRTEILNSHTEKLSALLFDDNAEMDANSFADLVYHLKQHFRTVTVWGMQGSYLRMAADDLFLESDNPSLKLIIYGAFQIMESDNIICKKRYRFRCESAQDLKTYLVGYIRANTVERQTNFITKCIMLGKAQELPERMDTLDFEELDEEE